MRVDLIHTGRPVSEVMSDDDDVLKVGQWYWVREWERNYNKKAKPVEVDPWLGCITHIGSNYAHVDGVGDHYRRIHFDKFEGQTTRRELDPQGVIRGRITEHQSQVRVLLNRVKQVTARLGIAPRDELAADAEESTTALAIAHGTVNIEEHKNALVKAQDETLPELFSKIEDRHEQMATWMKAELIPMRAEMGELQNHTEGIKDRIFTVSLYAGLCENAVKIRDGEPAPNGTKIHLFQRRHYMDEECLLDYKAGGMSFEDIHQFDRWLMKTKNRKRIFPHLRCVVAFRVRRNNKKRNAVNIAEFIHFANLREMDHSTFLYIRNGEQYFWVETDIDFGHRLFPDRSQSTLLGNGELYMDTGYGGDRLGQILTGREYDARVAEAVENKAKHKKEVKTWKKLPKKKRNDLGKPWAPSYFPDEQYEKVTPESVFYDDAMERIAKEAKSHNRVAIVLQGLLDRSEVFHPHPPWRLWTSAGFLAGIELVYDDSRVLEPGEMPDFQAYKNTLNAFIKRGTNTIGQELQWMRHEAEKENKRNARSWRYSRSNDHDTYSPYGNPGPGFVSKVGSMSRGGESCTFTWNRERVSAKTKWINNPDRPGWMMPDDSPIKTSFRCQRKFLFNVDAYSPGDYLQFYADHRMRVHYLKWAPLLLAAEDFHARKKKEKR